jgi:serine/threonine-protein kinase
VNLPAPSRLFDQVVAALAPAYALKSELGRGGMASVFLAHDRKHDRAVAIKVLAPDLAASIARDRFLLEIRLAARLAHPHILPLLDSGEAAGLPYYVMPYVDGETLRARLDREGPVPVDAALAIAAEVGDALEYAHAAGIIHRDVKPENVMMLSGHAVVMDFGVARAMHTARGPDDTTNLGVAVGTPAYMSPEQATGDPDIDARSDQYSLALTLFELISGVNPFAGPGARETIIRRLTGPVPRLRERLPATSGHLDEVLARAMATDPAERFQSVAAFLAALREGHARTESPAGVAAPRAETASLAVLPFVNLSRDEDSEYFSDGVTEEIITALSRLRNLRVAARSSAFAFKGQQQDVRQIGRALGVRSVLEGSVRRAGARVRVSAQLVEASSGFQLWSDRFDRDLDDIFAIQEDIARAIVSVLQVRLLGEAARPLAEQSTTSASAHDLYLRARFNLNQRVESALREAVAQLNAAVEHDPVFVLAHAALAEGHLLLGLYGANAPLETLPRARSASDAALAIDPSLGEAHSIHGSLAALLDWNWAVAEAAFRRAIILSPRAPGVRQRFAMDCLLPQRRFAEAIRELDEACLLDPLSLIIQASRGVVMHLSGDAAGAVDHLRRLVATHRQFAMAFYFLGAALRDDRELAASAQAFRDAIDASGGTPEMSAGLAQTLALDAGEAEAAAVLAGLTAQAETRYVSPALRAQVHLAMGNAPAALDLLEQAAEGRDPEVLYLATRRIYASLSGEPRFERLRSAIGLPSASHS